MVCACISDQSFAEPIVESVLCRRDLGCSVRLILDKLCLFPSFKLIGSKSTRTEIIGFKTSLNSICECDCVLQTQIHPLSPSRIQGMNSISHQSSPIYNPVLDIHSLRRGISHILPSLKILERIGDLGFNPSQF